MPNDIYLVLNGMTDNDYNNLGDTSTLADPSVITDLIDNRKNR